MVDNNSEDLIAKLKTLSKRELDVLWLRCKGMKYKDIGKALSIVESTVKTDMGRVYMKLGLDVLEPSARMKAIYDTFAPLLEQLQSEGKKARGTQPEVVEGVVVEDEEKPIPEPVQKMVENDEKAVVPVRPAPLVAPPKPPRKTNWFMVLVVGIVLGICLGAGGVYFVMRPFNGTLPFIPQPSPTMPTPTVIPSDTPVPSPTTIIPTQTPKVITQVVVVTATPLPTTEPSQPTQASTSLPASAISLPFSDNFTNGPNPAWQLLSGTWITANGRFTTLSDTQQQNWNWAILPAASWQNYRVTVNVQMAYPGAAAQGEYAIVVRVSDNNAKYLGFDVDTNSAGELALIGNPEWDVRAIAGKNYNDVPDTANIEIDAIGNSFTARANGQLYQQITLPGYDHGGVGLGTLCDNPIGKCTSFGNFKVEPLP